MLSGVDEAIGDLALAQAHHDGRHFHELGLGAENDVDHEIRARRRRGSRAAPVSRGALSGRVTNGIESGPNTLRGSPNAPIRQLPGCSAVCVIGNSIALYNPPGYRTLKTIKSGKLSQLRAENQKLFTALTWKDLVGHSMGGMIAAVMACLNPKGLRRLALICPAGLWIDERPIPDLFSMLPFELAKVLFPIPNRRLAKRLYRQTADTLLVWGREDRLIPLVCAQRRQALLPSSQLAVVDAAGHMAPYEQADALLEAIRKFLGAA